MTTVTTQHVLDYILDQISKEFNINHQTLVEKYGSVETVSNAILANTNNKKRVVRKVTKVVDATKEEPKVAVVTEVVAEVVVVAQVETPKKKVVRKVTKAVVEEPKVEAEAEVEGVAEAVVVAPVETPKKKVVRKATKVVEVVTEEPKVEAEVVVVAQVETPKNKVVCKATKAVEVVTEEPKVEVVASIPEENTEEKVKPAPKSIVKKVPDDNDINNVEVSTKVDNCDEVEEANVYVDTQTYNDEDSDSLEPREINGVNYYIDSSNYVYHFETQDLIGKLDNKGDNIIFLSNF